MRHCSKRRWLGHVRSRWILHRVVVVKWWRMASRSWSSQRLAALDPSAIRSCDDGIGAALVHWMVEQTPNGVNEEWVELISDLLLVGKVESTLKRYPTDVSIWGREERNVLNTGSQKESTYQTPFRCMGPIFTTCRIFSLLRMPSLLPLVIPATFSSFVPLIMWLSIGR